MSQDDKDMSKETEVALVGQKVEQLSAKVEELKNTFVTMIDDVHGHITREYNLVSRENDNKLQLAILELEKRVNKDVNAKVSKSALMLIAIFSALIAIVASSIITWVYLQNNLHSKPTPPTENRITVEQANSMVETITREMKKANKAYLKEARMKGSKSEYEIIE